MTSITHSERAHAEMRQDLKTSVRAKAVTPSANRVVCRQLHSEHVARGGAELDALLEEIRSSGRERVACAQAVVPAARASTSVDTSRASRHPGSSYIRYINRQLSAHKTLCAPARPLTDLERHEVRVRAHAQWQGMCSQEKSQWATRNRAENNKRARMEAVEDVQRGNHMDSYARLG